MTMNILYFSGFAPCRGGLLSMFAITTTLYAFAFQKVNILSRPSALAHTNLFATSTGTRICIDEDSPRDIESMIGWSTVWGGQTAEGIHLAPNDENLLEYGFIATQDLPANQPVLFVPNNMVWTGRKTMQQLGNVPAAEDLLIQSGASEHLSEFYLFLNLLKEYENGDASFWYPWLNSLPRYYSNGSSMTYTCCKCLPPLVGSLANNERIRFMNFCRALTYVDFLDGRTKINRDLAKWAFAVVSTRSFPTKNGDIQLVPMADMVSACGVHMLSFYVL